VKARLEVDQTRRGARGNVRSDETLPLNPAQAGVIVTPWMLPQSRILRLAVKQAYGVEARAATRDGPTRGQKPADKTVEGSARHELPVGPTGT